MFNQKFVKKLINEINLTKYECTVNFEQELKRQQSIDAVKDEINILEECQKHCLIEL